MKRLTYILLLLMIAATAKGQQLPLYSQYLYNKFLINPAVAGSDGYTSYNLTARQQWVGYKDAPRTFSFSGQTRILKKKYSIRTSGSKQTFRPPSDGKVGLGASVFSDKNGLIARTGFQVSYAYHTWVHDQTQLSFGLAATGTHYKIDDRALDFEDPNEPWLNNEIRNGVFYPDARFGIYLLNPHYSVGFSADQLFESSAKIGSSAYHDLRVERHYYFFGSYFFNLGVKDGIEPSFIFSMSELLEPQMDIGLTYSHDQSIWGGITYRTTGAIIGLLGFQYSNIFFGYSMDFTLQEIQRITYGTHELTVAVKFGDNKRKYRWLDRY